MSGAPFETRLRLASDLAPPAVVADPDGHPPLVDVADIRVDDATMAYVVKAQPAFDLLRAAAGQIAGVLVLAVAAGKGAAGHPMLETARLGCAEAGDLMFGVAVPPPAAHHHLHLRRAMAAVGEALAEARRHLLRGDDQTVDAVLARVKVAYSELQSAAAALPGFEMVALSQCCCAQHTGGSDAKVIAAIT
jgi:hypothetical protein